MKQCYANEINQSQKLPQTFALMLNYTTLYDADTKQWQYKG